MISIHAPLAGCDQVSRCVAASKRIFQSTHPLRGATRSPTPVSFTAGFQSTHPLRGATYAQYIWAIGELDFNPRTPCGVRRHLRLTARADTGISIHAPLAGCDHAYDEFVGYEYISIHAPLAGCDAICRKSSCRRKISIHAPLAGCDLSCVHGLARRSGNFNPRTPCGVRQLQQTQRSSGLKFQSTHPLRGATQITDAGIIRGGISIHAPLAGCDIADAERNRIFPDISIHAPLAGCDMEQIKGAKYDDGFQSTHPLRGATTSGRKEKPYH